MTPETVEELQRLAAGGDCYAAFKSVAVACGLTPGEAEQLWSARDEGVVDERDAGVELRAAGDAWLFSTERVDREDYR